MKCSLIGGFAVLALTAGCGGGGSGGSSTPVQPQTRLRTLTAGLSYVYSVSGTIRTTSSSTTTSVTGSITESYTSTTFNGGQVIAAASSTSLSLNSASPQIISTTEYLTQDTDANVALAGELLADGASRITSSSNVFAPGTFGANVSYSETVNYTNGDRVQHSFVTLGAEKVTVPAGTFDTWKCQENTVEGSVTVQNTEWYAPELGNVVKEQSLQTDTSTGTTLNLTAKLTGTNAN